MHDTEWREYDIDGLTELSKLIVRSQLFRQSSQYKELLDFVCRLRRIAPFNAMLLSIQKPSLLYAATEEDWESRFDRKIKDDARPLLILWPFGPVRLVYDLADTEGRPFPEHILKPPFHASGWLNDYHLRQAYRALEKQHFYIEEVHQASAMAGSVEKFVLPQSDDSKPPKYGYTIRLNRHHDANTRFTTLVHELGHVLLGHLGHDQAAGASDRFRPTHRQRELEAESVSYLVCQRLGVMSNAHQYMAHFIASNEALPPIDIYEVMKAAGRIESLVKPQWDWLSDTDLYR